MMNLLFLIWLSTFLRPPVAKLFTPLVYKQPSKSKSKKNIHGLYLHTSTLKNYIPRLQKHTCGNEKATP